MALLSNLEILVAHPWMGRGGSEATAMWALNTLQHIARVTFATVSPVDWNTLNDVYGTSVTPAKVKLVRATRIPWVRTGTRLAYWQRAYFERFCQSLPNRFDLCVSAYNPIHFNRPAIQLIGDFSFDKDAPRVHSTVFAKAQPPRSLLRSMYLAVGDQLAGRGITFIAGPHDQVVANSSWTAEVLKQRYQLANVPVLYPPASRHVTTAGSRRDPLGFVCMGRISPEKEIETVIAILDGVRAAGYAVTLDLVGDIGHDEYSRRIRHLADQRADWVRTPGFIYQDRKRSLLDTCTYGIHAARVEAFGIVVAEMAAAGVIPFVPKEGGSKEIVGIEELIYADIGEAVQKIVARIECSESHTRDLDTLRDRVTLFEPERFVDSFLNIIDDFMMSKAARG